MNSDISHLAQSHRSWGTAQCEEGQCLHNRASHGPTSKASPQTESCSRKQKRAFSHHLKHILHTVMSQTLIPYSPFEHQVEPVSNHSHPDEFNAHRRPQVKPKWEEDEEGVPQICRPGHPEKQALGVLIVALQVVGAAHPKTLRGIHDSIKHLRHRRLKWSVSDSDEKRDCCYQWHSWLVLYQWDPLPKRMHTLIFGPCTCVIKHCDWSCGGLSHKQVGKIEENGTSMGTFISKLHYVTRRKEVRLPVGLWPKSNWWCSHFFFNRSACSLHFLGFSSPCSFLD